MASTMIRGKYIICKVTSSTSAEVISDGAVFQSNGEIIEIGKYDVREKGEDIAIIGIGKAFEDAEKIFENITQNVSNIDASIWINLAMIYWSQDKTQQNLN